MKIDSFIRAAAVVAAAMLLTEWNLGGADNAKELASPSGPSATRYPIMDWPIHGEVSLSVDEDLESSPPRVQYRVRGEDDRVILTLPEFYGNGQWSYYDTTGVAFEDIDGDGRKDIVVLARYMTGIGPGGAEPFEVGGFYLRTDGGFARASDLEERVNSGDDVGKWETLDELIVLGRTRFQSLNRSRPR
jgi:hypothetical protein